MLSVTLLVGCSKDYSVDGKYYSTSAEGITLCMEFTNSQVRLSSPFNTGPWRDYQRDGNVIKVTGINLDGTKSTLTINILNDEQVEAIDFWGSQDVTFSKD